MSRKRFNLPSEWQSLVDAALASGWRIESTRSSHLKWLPPSGGVVFTSSTPSDLRAMKNARSQLRQKGLKV